MHPSDTNRIPAIDCLDTRFQLCFNNFGCVVVLVIGSDGLCQHSSEDNTISGALGLMPEEYSYIAEQFYYFAVLKTYELL